jgi:long-subunit acyl-CoA synthetase (AMP-forming)
VAQGYVGEKWGDVIKITDNEGWYSTGDLVKRNDDGSVSFIRRISQVVKL